MSVLMNAHPLIGLALAELFMRCGSEGAKCGIVAEEAQRQRMPCRGRGRRTDRGDQGAAMARRSAEMGAAYLCAEAGISTAVLENQAAYIAGWLKKLHDDRKLLIHAATQAQHAADYILGRRESCT
jgi:antirestriction protein ArdC